MIYNCKWYDGFMVDIFVILNVDNVIYFLRWMMFEGFLWNENNNCWIEIDCYRLVLVLEYKWECVVYIYWLVLVFKVLFYYVVKE